MKIEKPDWDCLCDRTLSTHEVRILDKWFRETARYILEELGVLECLELSEYHHQGRHSELGNKLRKLLTKLKGE